MPEVFGKCQQIRRHDQRNLRTPVDSPEQQSESTLKTVLHNTAHEWQINLGRSCRQLQRARPIPLLPSLATQLCRSVTRSGPLQDYKSRPMRGKCGKSKSVKQGPVVPDVCVVIERPRIANWKTILMTRQTILARNGHISN